jgi:cell division protein FtsB
VFRYFLIALFLLFITLQYRLWVGAGGRADVHRLTGEIATMEAENDKLRSRNAALEAEIDDLKLGEEATEERARMDMGMIKEGESFYLVIEPSEQPLSLPPVPGSPSTGSDE